jgi:hypothetical protein
MAGKEVRTMPKPEPKKKAKQVKTVTVQILSYGGRSIVWPPVAVVDGEDTIRFHAVNTEATIFLESAFSFEDMENERELFTLRKRQVLDIKVKPNVKADEAHADLSATGLDAVGGVHPYSVYCTESNDFAVGQSAPVIMIEPPEDKPGRGDEGP